jgi:hypothetical protein
MRPPDVKGMSNMSQNAGLASPHEPEPRPLGPGT